MIIILLPGIRFFQKKILTKTALLYFVKGRSGSTFLQTYMDWQFPENLLFYLRSFLHDLVLTPGDGLHNPEVSWHNLQVQKF